MKTLLTLSVVMLLAAPALTFSADTKVSDLQAITSPSSASLLLVTDPGASPQSRKYLLTNLVTQTSLNLKANLVSPALTGTPTINGASIETQLTNRVLKAGDTMTGALNAPSAALGSLVVTNGTFLSQITDSWTNAGTVYYALRVIVTNTASATGSKLFSFELSDGTVIASGDKSGAVFLRGPVRADLGIGDNGGALYLLDTLVDTGTSGSSVYIYGRNGQNFKIATQNSLRWEVSYTNGMFYPSSAGSGQIWVTAGTNASTIARVGGTLKVDTTQTGNVGGGEDNLISYTVPANVLFTNGDSLEFDCFGTFAADAHLKTLKAVYGGTTLITSTSLALNGLDWRITGKIIRTGAATQKATTTLTVAGTLLGSVTTTTTDFTSPAETLSGTVVFKCTGSDDDGSPASNAVVQEGMNLKFVANGN